MIWQERCELPRWKKGTVACAGRKSPCRVLGWQLRGWWQQLCSGALQVLPGRKPAASWLCHPVSCWLRKATLSPAQHLMDHIEVLWASCCGNGKWGKFSRGQQPAEVCTVVHGGKAKDTRHKVQEERFRLDRRKDQEQLLRVGGCALCPQRLSRPGHTKPTATWCHLALD